MNKYLKHYSVAVEHPGVSGFEHLETLSIRDKLADQEASLTSDEKAQLAAADRRLLASAGEFHFALAQITDLQTERRRRKPSPARWWWYLDVLAQLPVPPSSRPQAPELVPA